MKTLNYAKQSGAVLVIALVMLLVLTLLATSSMRGTALDARITGNHRLAVEQLNMANAALREGELRLLDPFNVLEKTQYVAGNCSLENTLNISGFNKPCLVDESSINIDQYFVRPIRELGAATNGSEMLQWMPYRGLDPSKEFVQGEGAPSGYWNAVYIQAGEIESGKVLHGEGEHYFLVTGQADNEVAVQSTVKTFLFGLNN